MINSTNLLTQKINSIKTNQTADTTSKPQIMPAVDSASIKSGLIGEKLMKNILIPQGLWGSSHQISSFFLREKCHGHMS